MWYALDEMPTKTWLVCCKDAVDSINRTDGVEHVRSKETVSCWHLTFRRNNESFPNPHIHSTKTALPPLLDRYPELAKSIVLYAKQNLNELSAELLYSYLDKVALPAMLEERRAELVNKTYTMAQLLGKNQLTKLSVPTIFRWMKCIDFKYEVQRKIYYVNGHDKPDSKKYRKKMVREYLPNELCMHSFTCLRIVWSRRRTRNQAQQWTPIYGSTNWYRKNRATCWFASIVPRENEWDDNVWQDPQC